jgi:L-fucose mutarotase/ribose pyranase (RbsD/FucU family)
VPEVLKAVLQLMPLDIYVDLPVALMEVVNWLYFECSSPAIEFHKVKVVLLGHTTLATADILN